MPSNFKVDDLQVRSKLESIDGIVPSTHGECVDVRGASDVSDLLTEFQVSHTLLSVVNPETGHPISGSRKTLAALTRMLRSRMPGRTHLKAMTACPSKLRWSDDGLERDLYIKMPTITILAMDGRRRWLDIKEL
ncbi:hypothetical protein Tco_1382178, partial [Tanacetum coccineum]